MLAIHERFVATFKTPFSPHRRFHDHDSRRTRHAPANERSVIQESFLNVVAMTSDGRLAVHRIVGVCQQLAGAISTRDPATIDRLLLDLARSIPDELPLPAFVLVRELVARVLEHLADAVHRVGLQALKSEVRLSTSEQWLRLAIGRALVGSSSVRGAHNSVSKVARAVVFMQDHHSRSGLTLDDVARHVHISRWHLERLFRQVTGMGYAAHLRRMRIDTAQALLATSTEPIKRVATLAGFGSVHTMERHFHRLTGMPPSAWRRKRTG